MVLAYLGLRAFEQYHDLDGHIPTTIYINSSFEESIGLGFEVAHRMESNRRGFSRTEVGNRLEDSFGIRGNAPLKIQSILPSIALTNRLKSSLHPPPNQPFFTNPTTSPTPTILSRQNGLRHRTHRPRRTPQPPTHPASQTLPLNLVPPPPNKNSHPSLQKPPLYNHPPRPPRP